jgi:hypothetical protein
MGVASYQRNVVVVLVPVTSEIAVCFRMGPIPVRLWLPPHVCPGVRVGPAVFASVEVVPQPSVASAQRGGVRPGCELPRRHGKILITIVEKSPICPAGPTLSILHVVHFVGAHGYVDIWTLVVEDILHTTPCRPILAVFRPDECFMGFYTAVFLAILDPGPVVSTVFLDVASVRHGHRLVEHGDMMRHGWRFLDEVCGSSDV